MRQYTHDRHIERHNFSGPLEEAEVADRDPRKEEEPAFRVTDRRRVGREDPQEPPGDRESASATSPEPPSPAGDQAPPTEPGEEQGRDPVHLSTPDLVRIFLAELHMRALIHMGLIPNPATRLVAKDLSQARLAIDCVAALIDQLSPSAEPAEHDDLQEMLASLRMYFVRQSGA